MTRSVSPLTYTQLIVDARITLRLVAALGSPKKAKEIGENDRELFGSELMSDAMPSCPSCQSESVVKNGEHLVTANKTINGETVVANLSPIRNGKGCGSVQTTRRRLKRLPLEKMPAGRHCPGLHRCQNVIAQLCQKQNTKPYLSRKGEVQPKAQVSLR